MTRPVGHEAFQGPAGPVRSGQDVLEISRVESGGVLQYHGSGRVILTRSDPREGARLGSSGVGCSNITGRAGLS